MRCLWALRRATARRGGGGAALGCYEDGEGRP